MDILVQQYCKKAKHKPIQCWEHGKAMALLLLLLLCAVTARAQHVAVKTNALYWATTTPNVSVETRLAPKLTLDMTVGYNPFTYSDNKKLKHILVQPELRYWLCSTYAGHFLGAHLLYSHFNAGGVDMPLGLFPDLKDHRFQGDLGAVGIAYGYSWMLGRRWSVEAEVGLGIGVAHYRKYLCEKCGTQVSTETKALFMPTKLALSVVYNLW